MDKDAPLKLTDREVTSWFNDPAWAQRFPPIMTIEEASDLLQIPVETLRDWRSRELLSGCCRKLGKRVRFIRDRLIKHVFNEGLGND